MAVQGCKNVKLMKSGLTSKKDFEQSMGMIMFRRGYIL